MSLGPYLVRIMEELDDDDKGVAIVVVAILGCFMVFAVATYIKGCQEKEATNAVREHRVP